MKSVHLVFSLLLIGVPFAAAPVIAQTSQVPATSYGMTTNITNVPSPGDGHDYLRDLNETVNPANGALSVQIAVSAPRERGFNVPIFAFLYNSDTEQTVYMQQRNGPCTPTQGTGSYSFQYGPPICVFGVGQPRLVDTSWLNNNRSSQLVNTGPNTLAFQRQVTYTYPETNVLDTACQVNTGYVYEDFFGKKHDMGILNIMPVNNNGGGGNGLGSCENSYGIFPILTGGDAQFKALTFGALPRVTANSEFNPGQLGALIADANGNALLNGIDANGNVGRGTGRSGYLPGDGTLMPGDANQTPVVGTRQIQFPGYATPYTYTIANQPITYQIGYTDITPWSENLCGGNSGGNGGNVASSNVNGQAESTSVPKYTAIALPNGLSYGFQYDPVYGLISRITYPTGATVQYTWGTNANSESMSWGPASGARTGTVEPVDGHGVNWSMQGGTYYNTDTCNFRHDFPAITKRVVSYDGVRAAQEQDFSYSTTWADATTTQWSSKTTTVTTIDLLRPGNPSFKTIYTYGYGVNIPSPLGHVTTSGVPLEDSVAYYDYSGSLLKTIKKVWNGWFAESQIGGECTILPNGSVRGEFYRYQSYPADYTHGPYIAQTDVKNDIAEYDYGTLDATCTQPSTTPARETVVTFANFGATPPLPVYTVDPGAGDSYSDSLPGLWNRPSTVKTYDHGTLIAETDYSYDETALVPVSSPLNHDETSYGPGSTTPRGNATTITKKCFLTGGTCPDAVSHIVYDTTGQPVNITDGNGNTTTLSYIDNYTTDDGAPAGNTNTYVTSITRPTTNGVQHVSTYQWDFNKGELRKGTDENNQVSSYQYNDPWNRLTQSKVPDGGQTTLTYNDAGPNPSVSMIKLQTALGVSIASTTVMDGVGHPIQTQLTSDPSGTDYVDTTYDGLGLRYTVSNPYRSTQESTYGLTTYQYDALGRSVSVTHPDGTAIINTYKNNITTNTDEVGNSWTQTADGFDRMTSVVEPNGATTSYIYDMLNNLMSVNQTGLSGEVPRTRSFSYDSLSQLLTSSNPETGTICYGQWGGNSVGSGTCQNGYDANGNLQHKTDARGATFGYNYDALNRLISETSADISRFFTYDVSALPNGFSSKNPIGRLVYADNNNGTNESYSYDAMGRTVFENQCVPGGCSDNISAQYDLAGNMVYLQYPDGLVITQQFDSAGKLKSVNNGLAGSNTVTYFTANSYWPSGALQSASLGNTVIQSVGLNKRLQPCRISSSNPTYWVPSGGGNLFDEAIFYSQTNATNCGAEAGNNGNIRGIVDNVQPSHSQLFSYDSLNRLTAANSADSVYNHTYNYDSFGNMTLQDNLNPSSGIFYQADPMTNRLLRSHAGNVPAAFTDFVYDAAGNLKQTNDGISQAINYVYDSLGQLRQVSGGANANYQYDSSGNRVFKQTASSITEYTYFAGLPIAEYDSTGAWADYIYANGQRVAKTMNAMPVLALTLNVDAGNGGGRAYFDDTQMQGYTVRAGDKLQWNQYQSSTSAAGVIIQASNGVTTEFNTANEDQTGMWSNTTNWSNQWQTRTVDLGNLVGSQVTHFEFGQSGYATGTALVQYRNAAIISADGTVHSAFNGQPVNLTPMPDNTMTTAQVSFPNAISVDPYIGTHYYLADQLGTVQMEMDENANVIWQGRFTPFGQEIVGNSTYNLFGAQPGDGTNNHYKFTGKERDNESGLDYFGARYYGSSMGRFMSPDWSSKADPVPYANLSDPQSLNLYSYVLNNPLTKIDPNGHDWFNVDGKWQWQKGHTYHDADGNATKAKGYAGLLVAEKTGVNKQGATTFKLTLYDQNKVAATGTGFSGNSNMPGMDAIKVGNYQILGRFDAPPTGPNPASADNNPPPVYGYQKIDPSLNSYANAVYQAYGPMRARLNSLDGNPAGVYFHGQFGDAFHSEGWTHGCLSYGRDTTIINYMGDHFGSSWTGVSVGTPVVKP